MMESGPNARETATPSERKLAAYLDSVADIRGLLEVLQGRYDGRGIELVKLGQRWMFRTADDHN